jgi:hypothetical protein
LDLLFRGHHLSVILRFRIRDVKLAFLLKLTFVFLRLEDACLEERTLLLLTLAKPVEATVLPLCFFLFYIKVSRIPDPQILPALYLLRKGKGFSPPNSRVEVTLIEA